jgi:hypothetical protein
MMGTNGMNNIGGEGVGGNAGGASMGNMGGDEIAGSVKKKDGIDAASGTVSRNDSASGAGLEAVLQVPPPAALLEEQGTTCPWGWTWEWGWAYNQELSNNRIGPIDDVRRSFLPCPSVNLFNY